MRRWLKTDVVNMFSGWGDDVVTTIAFADPNVAEEIASGAASADEAGNDNTNDDGWLVKSFSFSGMLEML